MPTILTPPGVHRPRRPGPHDLGEGDSGSGRRPPTDKRTGGNGDGDNWSDRPQGRRGPRERLSRARIGLFFALGGDLMFFVALVSVFFVAKTSGHFDAYSRFINDWLPTAIPSILWLNTAVLLISSVSAEIARRSMFREVDLMDEWFGFGRPTSRRAALWLSATLAPRHALPRRPVRRVVPARLAARLLQLQRRAATSSTSSPSRTPCISSSASLPSSPRSHILFRSRQLATRQVVVDATVWYWHAMGILWIFLFALLEYGQ